MPIYHDPITLEEEQLTQETVVYIIQCGTRFAIKAVSPKDAHQLKQDPITRATCYWLVDTKQLLANQQKNQCIFINNILTTQLISSIQVKYFLGIDTALIKPSPFPLPQSRTQILHFATDRNCFFNPSYYSNREVAGYPYFSGRVDPSGVYHGE